MIDILIQRLTIFNLFNLTAEIVLGFKHELEKILLILITQEIDAFVTDKEEQVFDSVGNDGERIKLHHRAGALDRVHDTENFIDIVRREIALLLVVYEHLVESVEKTIGFEQIGIQHPFHFTIHESYTTFSIDLAYIHLISSENDKKIRKNQKVFTAERRRLSSLEMDCTIY